VDSSLIFGALLVWSLKSIILLFAVVFLVAMVLNPIVAFLERRHIRRGLAVALLALVFLALFALATALSFHRNFADQNQMIHFLKNVMLAGGLLQIVYFGAGPLSVDASRKASQ